MPDKYFVVIFLVVLGVTLSVAGALSRREQPIRLMVSGCGLILSGLALIILALPV